MKQFFYSIISSLFIAFLSLSASAKDFKAIFFVHGTLGDKSFMDSAQRGMDKAKQELGIKTQTVEAGLDSTQWEPAIRDIVEFEDFDVLIAVTYPMAGVVEQLAQENPDKKFILIDAAVNYEACSNKCDNVYSLLFKQNEASFLAGAYSALMTTKTDIPHINNEKVIGIIGGQEVTVIKDFAIGFEQGAKQIDPETKILVQYANSWTDPAKGKEISKALYGEKADIIFSVAGGTGQGIFEGAKEAKRYAIGVDADQAQILEASNPDLAAAIMTSVLKNVDAGLFSALQKAKLNELNYGQSEHVGLAEGAVGLAKNSIYENLTPKDVSQAVDELEQKVIDGEISVRSAFTQ